MPVPESFELPPPPPPPPFTASWFADVEKCNAVVIGAAAAIGGGGLVGTELRTRCEGRARHLQQLVLAMAAADM